MTRPTCDLCGDWLPLVVQVQKQSRWLKKQNLLIIAQLQCCLAKCLNQMVNGGVKWTDWRLNSWVRCHSQRSLPEEHAQHEVLTMLRAKFTSVWSSVGDLGPVTVYHHNLLHRFATKIKWRGSIHTILNYMKEGLDNMFSINSLNYRHWSGFNFGQQSGLHLHRLREISSDQLFTGMQTMGV